jgi:phosphoribosylaminoimidazolecarboxamide formyltransferase/IMP cyclohydrolase
MIAKHFADFERIEFRDLSMGGQVVQPLRYGENPSQRAKWFRVRGEKNGLHQARILQGKELSYNNLLDLDAAISTLREFSGCPAAVAVKHNNPCGVALAKTGVEALSRAMAADPQSVFGGIVAVNATVDEAMAKEMLAVFLECVIAPSFSNEAKSILATKKNLRLLEWPDFQISGDAAQFRSIAGGFLVQSRDQVSSEWGHDWSCHGANLELTSGLKADLVFANQVAAHLKSNAIAVVENGQTLGLGMGQVNRVDAVEQALARAHKFHPNYKNAVLASDAFFPFSDSIDKIAKAGVRYVIQPGGSVKDDEVKARAHELGVTMIFTGRRHFTH